MVREISITRMDPAVMVSNYQFNLPEENLRGDGTSLAVDEVDVCINPYSIIIAYVDYYKFKVGWLKLLKRQKSQQGTFWLIGSYKSVHTLVE